MKSNHLKILLCLLWLFMIVLPLLRMLSTMAGLNLFEVMTARKFSRAFWQSLNVSSVATFISVSVAGVLSWAVARTNVKHKQLISTLIIVPMLIPSISHGMGLIIIFGANGVVSKIFGLTGGIYGFWGIVFGSVMYSFPVAYLMLYDILRYEDGTPYEAAEVIGLGAIDRFFAITLPYLRKPLISVIFATFTMIITDYGVPLMIGGKYITLPVMMYQDVIGMLDFGKGSAIGVVLLIPAAVACVLDMVSRDSNRLSFVGNPHAIKDNHARDLVAKVIIFAVIVAIFVPIVAFSVIAFIKKYPVNMAMSFAHAARAFEIGALKYLANSLIIAVAVSLLGTALALFNAYMTARAKTKLSYFLHLMSIVSLAVPGIVLGLSYVMFFKGSMIYGGLVILLVVNITHFFASPYLMAYNTFSKLNENLESVGLIMGISRLSVVRDVILPQSKQTIVKMMSYFFINSMMTISAVSFLSNTFNKPLSLMIPQFEGQMQIECAAFVSLVILGANVMMKILEDFSLKLTL